MGAAAAVEFTQKVMDFANSVSTGLVGSVGLALLLWTLLGTIKKVEDGFNFLWRVEHARSFTRRVTEYVALLIVGPIVVVSFIGLSHNALETASVGLGRYMPFLERVVQFSKWVSPYFMVAAIFTAVYMYRSQHQGEVGQRSLAASPPAFSGRPWATCSPRWWCTPRA
jgi:membrane protein